MANEPEPTAASELNEKLGHAWEAYYAKCEALGRALDRIVELEAKHPKWMKRIQRERKEEQQRCIEKLLELVPMCDMELTREYLREELAKDA